MREVKEADVQHQIVAWFGLLGVRAIVIPNHGKWNPKQGRYNYVDKDHIPGVPDVAVVLNEGKTLWIETKRPIGGVVSICQEAFHAHLVSRGHMLLVARSVAEVETFCRSRGLV